MCVDGRLVGHVIVIVIIVVVIVWGACGMFLSTIGKRSSWKRMRVPRLLHGFLLDFVWVAGSGTERRGRRDGSHCCDGRSHIRLLGHKVMIDG